MLPCLAALLGVTALVPSAAGQTPRKPPPTAGEPPADLGDGAQPADEPAVKVEEDLPPAGAPIDEPPDMAADSGPLLPAPPKLEVLPGAMARGIGRVEGRGIWVGSADRQFIFRFSGFAHMDMRAPLYLDNDPRPSEVIPLVRRARFAGEGTTFGNLDYRIMFDPAVDVYPLDAYIDWRPHPEFNLRVGKFKSPFGFERRARAFALVFNERGLPTMLAPNRDVGVFLHGQTANGFFSYDVAVLGGAADLESIHAPRGTPELAGRIYFQPFRLWESPAVLRHFGVGFSGTRGHEVGSEDDPRLGGMQSLGRDRFFRYRHGDDDDVITFADGERRRWSVHGHWRYERFNTMWEYIWSGQYMTAGGNSRFIANQAWQVYAGVALTDDEWGFFGIVPRRPFDPTRGQYGAVALAARYNELYIDRQAFPTFANPDDAARNARAGALSLHWVFNENLKTQFDFEATGYEGGAEGGANRATELTFVARVQGFY